MEQTTVTLTEVDRSILDSYKHTMDGLADYLGPAYELVLHSLESYEHSVIKIINGHHTGRTEGAPITDLALSMLSALENQVGRDYISYRAKNRMGRPLKAATILVRGEHCRVIALLCMNFYLDTPLSELMTTWTSGDANGHTATENFAENTDELLDKLVADAVRQTELDPAATARTRNKLIVELLCDWGVFRMKSSVDQVAAILDLSRNTVYLHLRNYVNREK